MRVTRMCLGTMALGTWGNDDRADCVRLIHDALEAGINFVDTADIYAHGVAEEIVGEALVGRRDDVVLATKVNGPMGGDPNQRGNSRRWIVRAVEDSLRRLRTDWIDLYQVHHPDPATPIDETLAALSDLIHCGKVRAIGSSSFAADEIVDAQWIATVRGRERFWCEQPPYSIFVREIETSVLPTCKRHGMGVIVWGILNGGWLTGKYRRDRQAPEGSRGDRVHLFHRFAMERAANQVKLDLLEPLLALADDLGRPLGHMAIAWALEHPVVTSVVIGPRTRDQLRFALEGVDLVLERDVLDRIDEIVPPGTTIDHTDTSYQPVGHRLSERRRHHDPRMDPVERDPIADFVASQSRSTS